MLIGRIERDPEVGLLMPNLVLRSRELLYRGFLRFDRATPRWARLGKVVAALSPGHMLSAMIFPFAFQRPPV